MPTILLTNATSFSDLQAFARQAGNEKIRAKTNSNGHLELYTSSKTGTGLKNWLFGTSEKRQARAYQAISNILFNIPRPNGNAGLALGVALTHAQTQIPNHGEIRGHHLQALVGDATTAIENSQRAQLRQSVPNRNDLPLGMQVNNNGVITGQVNLATTQLGPNVVPIDQALTQTAQNEMNNTTVIGGVTISSKCSDDMVRMNL